MNSVEERIEELKNIVLEEDEKIIPSCKSEKDMVEFINDIKNLISVNKTRPYIVLMDNGNFRAIWRNPDTQIGISFLGDKRIQYTIIQKDDLRYGSDNMNEFKQEFFEIYRRSDYLT